MHTHTQLERNSVTVLLSNWLDGGEEEWGDDAATRPATRVELNLDLSAYANARTFYEARRKQLDKQSRTLAANDRALKQAEKKAALQLKQVGGVLWVCWWALAGLAYEWARGGRGVPIHPLWCGY